MEGFLTSPLRCYYDLEAPPGGPSRRPLLIALHGYEGNKESMMRLAQRMAGEKMIVISLQGPYQFFLRGNDPKRVMVGFGWGTSYRGLESVALHHHNINALIELAVRDHRADAARVFLLAFSQSCSYNYRFAFSHPGKVRGVIAVCGGIPGDWETNPAYAASPTDILHIAATRDQWYSREKNESFRQRLPRFARSVDFRFYNSPHRFPRNAIPHIRRWIEARV